MREKKKLHPYNTLSIAWHLKATSQILDDVEEKL